MENGVGQRLELSQGSILELIPPNEGALRQYYGRIRNGKTYAATSDIIDDLNSGQVVYANWPVKWEGKDQRKEFFARLLGALGLKKKFWVYPKTNFHFVDLRDLNNVLVDNKALGKNFYDWFATLTSCSVYLDEGHIYYDSYLALKMNLKNRIAILDTGHYDRTINIISQRPTAIHAVLRGNVNQFFKCEKTMDFLGWKIFKRTEFQDVANEVPNEERETIVNPKTGEKSYGEYVWAISEKTYWGRKKIYEAYNTKYRRFNTPESQSNEAHIYKLSWKEIMHSLFRK